MDTTMNYQLLGNAVVTQAAWDYMKALCRQHKYPDEKDTRVYELERFFLGDTILLYTKLDGEMLMNKIRERVADANYDIKVLNKMRNLTAREEV